MQYDGSNLHETSRTYLQIDPRIRDEAIRGICALARDAADAKYLARVLGLIPLELPDQGELLEVSSHQSGDPSDSVASLRSPSDSP